MSKKNPTVYFEVLRNTSYESRANMVHIGTFRWYGDALEVRDRQLDYGQPRGLVKPTLDAGEAYGSVEDYERHLQQEREARQAAIEEQKRRALRPEPFGTYDEERRKRRDRIRSGYYNEAHWE